ncbi:tail fiber protein [Nocardioides sp.]|uniref:phage tail protein n=1 Tax=Nocardioides sp. TaxID=35761 RepID=UPI0026106BFA|nr:tail fiber protein [Nocardioides sp.]
MADPFVAEIRPFAFNFPPRGWAFCAGQVLPISQNTALFSLLGTTYGGDGRSSFALPDLQGRAAMAPGQGPGLSLHDLGEVGGTETVTLLASEMPSHTHALVAANASGDLRAPGSGRALAAPSNGALYAPSTSALQPLHASELASAGSSTPHNNMQPYLTLNFCIALQGVFPPRW